MRDVSGDTQDTMPGCVHRLQSTAPSKTAVRGLPKYVTITTTGATRPYHLESDHANYLSPRDLPRNLSFFPALKRQYRYRNYRRYGVRSCFLYRSADRRYGVRSCFLYRSADTEGMGSGLVSCIDLLTNDSTHSAKVWGHEGMGSGLARRYGVRSCFLYRSAD